MGNPVVHCEINTALAPDLARFDEAAFERTLSPDGDDDLQIATQGVCGGTGEPGVDRGIAPREPW